MKTKFFLIAVILFTVIFSSCSSSDDDSNTTPATDGFTWTENGGSSLQTGLNPRFSAQYNTFIVENSSGTTLFEINLNEGIAGTYSLGSNYAIYYGGSTNFVPTAGSLIITSNANNKISGTFSATGSTGTVTSVTGTFTNVVVNP